MQPQPRCAGPEAASVAGGHAQAERGTPDVPLAGNLPPEWLCFAHMQTKHVPAASMPAVLGGSWQSLLLNHHAS